MSKIVEITVNGMKIKAKEGEFLLGILLTKGFEVPHLCYHEAVTPYASCRLCLVEVNRGNGFRIATSCNHPVMDGMEVRLDTPEILEERRNVFEVLLAQAPDSQNLRLYAKKWGVEGTFLRVQEGDCILCGLCERVCREVIGVSAITFAGRGANKILSAPYDDQNPSCIGCGSCARVCPTESIKVIDTGLVREIPKIHSKHELVPCRICGRGTLTKQHAQWLAKRTNFPETDFYICEKCKTKETAKVYARVIQ